MNTPNKISLARICIIPLMIFFYLSSFIPFSKIIALIILIIAESTDFLDGYLARKNNQITDLGKFLDPIADKILTMSALLLVISDNTLMFPYGVIIGIIILGRELIISAFRQVAATKKVVMAADKWGKLKTVFQDIALPLFFLLSFLIDNNTKHTNLYNAFVVICYTSIVIATVLTIFSGCNYIVKNKSVLASKNNISTISEKNKSE